MSGKIVSMIGIGKPRGSVSGHDEYDSIALGDGASHGAGGQQCLVVRVSMDEDQGARTGAAQGLRGGSRCHGVPIVAYGHPSEDRPRQ